MGRWGAMGASDSRAPHALSTYAHPPTRPPARPAADNAFKVETRDSYGNPLQEGFIGDKNALTGASRPRGGGASLPRVRRPL